MLPFLRRKAAFIGANIVVMYFLHGNSKQFWPKIPYLSLRNESIPEHSRLLFNTLAIVTVGQVALGRMPRFRLPARLVAMGLLPLLLPLMIGFGQRGLQLRGHRAEIYNLSLVPLLPIVAASIEDGVVSIIEMSEKKQEEGSESKLASGDYGASSISSHTGGVDTP